MRKFLVLPLLALLGCPAAPQQPAAPSAPAAPEAGGTLVVAIPSDLASFNPLVARGSLNFDVLQHMYPVLTGAALDCRLRFGPGLAESWVWSEDGKTVTLNLSREATWQDGEPIDADDVLFTLQLAADPEAASPLGRGLVNLDPLRPPEKVDSHTLRLHYREAGDPTAMLADVARCLVVPEHALRGVPAADLRGAEFSTHPVTSGPFVLHRWEPGVEIELRRRAEHPTCPLLDRVILRIMGEPNAREMAFTSGDVDMLIGPEISSVSRLRDTRPGTQVLRRGYRFLEFVAWNLQDPRFADVRVRRALAHAIDTEALIATLLMSGEERYGRRATGSVSPELCGVVDGSIEPLAFDPALARALLAEAGWTDGDGDGVVENAGVPLSFTLVHASGDARRDQAVLILQQQLAEVGVRVQLSPMDRSALYQRLRERDYEAALSGWATGLHIDPGPYWHSGDDAPFNITGYAEPDVDRLIEAGDAARSHEEAEPIWREMLAKIYEDQPYCFLYWADEVVLLDGRFQDAGSNTLDLFHDLHRWWVPAQSRVHD